MREADKLVELRRGQGVQGDFLRTIIQRCEKLVADFRAIGDGVLTDEVGQRTKVAPLDGPRIAGRNEDFSEHRRILHLPDSVGNLTEIPRGDKKKGLLCNHFSCYGNPAGPSSRAIDGTTLPALG